MSYRLSLLCLFFIFSCMSHAHDAFSGEAKAIINDAGAMTLELNLAAVTAEVFSQDIVNKNNQLSPENLSNIKSHLVAKAQRFFRVTVNGQPITASQVDIKIVSEVDAVVFTLDYPESVLGTLGFRSDYIAQTNPEYQLTLSVFDNQHTQLGLFIHNFSHRYDELLIDGKSRQANNDGVFSRFFSLGIEHILIGFDHLIFLLALLLVCRNWQAAALIITCFTLAHSVTLALAALQIVALPSVWVELLIALTIIYVGLENLYFKHRPRHRWLLTCSFGLIHGLGFANVLMDIGLGTSGAPIFIPLMAFNLGVEIGQLSLAIVVLPLLWYLRKWQHFEKTVLPLISIFIVLLGVVWAYERLI